MKNSDKVKVLSIGLLLILLLAIFLTFDAGYTYYHAVKTAGHEGIGNASLIYKIFGFPDSGWSIEGFYSNFKDCSRFLGVVLTANIGFFVWKRKKRLDDR